MQELLAQQNSGSPYNPVGSTNMAPPTMATPPQFTSPSSGAFSTPQDSAQHTQSFGRGEDSMLVHMTPDEVNSLRGLAQRFGGDLTQNPHTGLPEAGWLGKLLPTLLGGLGMAFGIPPIWMGALGAAGGTIATGDLGKGLMMGLQAYGGASLGGALGVGSKLGSVGAGLGLPGAQAGTAATVGTGMSTAGATGVGAANTAASGLASGASGALGQASGLAGGLGTTAAKTGLSGVMQGFGNAAKQGLGTGILSKAAVPLATMGLMNGVSSAMTPDPAKASTTKEEPGTSQFTAAPRQLIAPDASNPVMGGKFDPTNIPVGEHKWFTPSRSAVLDASGKTVIPGTAAAVQPTVTPTKGSTSTVRGFNDPIWDDPSKWNAAHGGQVPSDVFHMQSGGHVMPAKTVAAFGNFSTDAGQRKLAGMGGIPIRGPGDGVSDEVPAMIDGDQQARVANGEVYFPPQAVQKLGGNEKLYAMMKRAEVAANKAKNGEKVRGLA